MFGAALLTGCAAPHAINEPPPPARFGYTDLTDDFAALYDAGAGSTDAAWAARIRAGMAERLPGFYEPERFEADEAWFAARMARYLASYPSERAGPPLRAAIESALRGMADCG